MRERLRTLLKVPVHVALLVLSMAGPAHAFSPTFNLGAETQLHRDTLSPSFFPILSGGIRADSTTDPETTVGESHEYKVDLTVRISPTHPKAFAITSQNFYFGEADQSYVSPLRFSFGRKRVGWSKLDAMWGLGEFEPLDSWDRLRYSTQGLTGIFAYTETDTLNFRFFASFLTIPETTPNIVIENHRFVLEHPQAISTAPQTYTLLDRPTPLGYELDVGSITKIVFRPSIAFSLETDRKLPVGAKLSYGYLPLNYFPIALQATLAIPLDQIIVNLRPRLLHHHLYNGEVSYRVDDSWTFGLVAMINDPVSDTPPADYTTTPLTESKTVSPWIQVERPWGNLQLAWLRTWGGLEADVGPYADPNQSIFSSRILYRNASQLKGRVLLNPTSPQSAYIEARYLHEFAVNGNWIAADFVFYPQSNLSLYVGGDIISAEKTVAPDRGAEFLADMRAIDRVRLGVQYAF
jgi:hypothetical protein